MKKKQWNMKVTLIPIVIGWFPYILERVSTKTRELANKKKS